MSEKKYRILSEKERTSFIDTIYTYYNEHKRPFAWRETNNPYHIVVSEIMLQQTQTDRVKEKYTQFIEQFPTVEILAGSTVSHLISVWQGLGYNRRALALHVLAQRVSVEFGGVIPANPEDLQTFKGIGPATASSICAFAYNQPTVFVETNIRAVFIHSFFRDQKSVSDEDIMPLVAQTVDQKNPREWYYALMDYGVMLKKVHKNPSRKSAHYAVQSKFEGSDRQVRGCILKMLIELPMLSTEAFIERIPRDPAKIARILGDLEREGFIVQRDGRYSLSRG